MSTLATMWYTSYSARTVFLNSWELSFSNWGHCAGSSINEATEEVSYLAWWSSKVPSTLPISKHSLWDPWFFMIGKYPRYRRGVEGSNRFWIFFSQSDKREKKLTVVYFIFSCSECLRWNQFAFSSNSASSCPGILTHLKLIQPAHLKKLGAPEKADFFKLLDHDCGPVLEAFFSAVQNICNVNFYQLHFLIISPLLLSDFDPSLIFESVLASAYSQQI